MATNLRWLRRRCQELFGERGDEAFWQKVGELAKTDLLAYGLWVHGGEHPTLAKIAMSQHAWVIAGLYEQHEKLLVVTPPEHGKLLYNHEVIPTPKGWRRADALAVGDQVFGAGGQPIRILAIHREQAPEMRRVTFSDGTYLDCCIDHNWFTRTRKPEHGSGVKTTAEIAATLRTKDGRSNHAVPVCGPLQVSEADLPIDPWLLGYWLGNGHVGAGRMTSHSADADEITAHCAALGYVCEAKPDKRPGMQAHRVSVRGLMSALRALGVLHDKHIPDTYLWASEAQRRALLAGLLDADGYAGGRRGQVEWTSRTPALADGAEFLIRSLGYKPRRIESMASYNGKITGQYDRLVWTMHDMLFTTVRKRAMWQPAMPQGDRLKWRMIVSVEPLPSAPGRCFQVDSPDGLYLAGKHLIVTHNTTLSRWYLEWWLGAETEKAFRGEGRSPSALFVSNTAGQAQKRIMSIAATLEANPRYKALFPHVAPDKAWGWGKDLLYLKRPTPLDDPSLMGSGCPGPVQGGRVGLVVVDDPTDQQDARSETTMQGQLEFHTGVLDDRLLEGGRQVDNLTRWSNHRFDIARNLLESEQWAHVVMPVYGFWAKHPEYGVGHRELWPEVWSAQRIEAKRRSKELAATSGLFQLTYLCDPRVAEGELFKRDWLVYQPAPLEPVAI